MNRVIISLIAPWGLTVALCILLGIGIVQLPALVRALRNIPKSVCAAMIIVSLFGTYFRFAWVPDTHRIYFDEDRYLMYAVSFARSGHALGIQLATPDTVLAGDPDPGARVTVPLIHAWVLKLFGYRDQNLFMTAKILSALQIVLIGVLSYMYLRRPIVSLAAMSMTAFLPILLFWSTTTNLDSIFVLFGILTSIGAVWYGRSNTPRSRIFFIAAITLLLFVRIEGILFLFISASFIASERRARSLPLATKRDLLLLLPLAPILTLRGIVALPLFSQTWCCAEATPLEIFQVGYFWRNTIPNLTTLFIQKEFPVAITILSCIALVGLHGRIFPYSHVSRTKMLVFAIWIFAYFMLYSFYYVGIFYSYTFSGSYGRFFLMLVPPFILLASITIDAWYEQFVHAQYGHKTVLLAIALGTLLSLYPTLLSYRTLISISPWDHLVDEGPRLMRAFLTEDMIPMTPKGSVIIHPLTAAVMMSGRSAVSIEAFLFNAEAISFVIKRLEQHVPVYILVTDVCEATPYKCTKIQDVFTYTPVDIPNRHIPGFSVEQVHLKKML